MPQSSRKRQPQRPKNEEDKPRKSAKTGIDDVKEHLTTIIDNARQDELFPSFFSDKDLVEWFNKNNIRFVETPQTDQQTYMRRAFYKLEWKSGLLFYTLAYGSSFPPELLFSVPYRPENLFVVKTHEDDGSLKEKLHLFRVIKDEWYSKNKHLPCLRALVEAILPYEYSMQDQPRLAREAIRKSIQASANKTPKKTIVQIAKETRDMVLLYYEPTNVHVAAPESELSRDLLEKLERYCSFEDGELTPSRNALRMQIRKLLNIQSIPPALGQNSDVCYFGQPWEEVFSCVRFKNGVKFFSFSE